MIIGIIGGIASGKSTIVNVLEEEGAIVIKADEIGHQIYNFQTFEYHKIINVFGSQIINEDKQLNRKKLGNIVFKSKDEMKKLTDIIWPAILNRIQSLIIQKQRELEKKSLPNIIFVEAAVLLEANWHKKNLFTNYWLVEVSPILAKNRLIKRNKLTEGEAIMRIQSQLSNIDRQKILSNNNLSYTVISNIATKEDLCKEVIKLYQQIKKSK
jgi:dephospho-CoA kinase